MAPGLFVVEGDSKNTLIEGLEALYLHIKDSSSRAYPAALSSEKGLEPDPKIETDWIKIKNLPYPWLQTISLNWKNVSVTLNGRLGPIPPNA